MGLYRNETPEVLLVAEDCSLQWLEAHLEPDHEREMIPIEPSTFEQQI